MPAVCGRSAKSSLRYVCARNAGRPDLESGRAVSIPSGPVAVETNHGGIGLASRMPIRTTESLLFRTADIDPIKRRGLARTGLASIHGTVLSMTPLLVTVRPAHPAAVHRTIPNVVSDFRYGTFMFRACEGLAAHQPSCHAVFSRRVLRAHWRCAGEGFRSVVVTRVRRKLSGPSGSRQSGNRCTYSRVHRSSLTCICCRPNRSRRRAGSQTPIPVRTRGATNLVCILRTRDHRQSAYRQPHL